jgi:hypothetical protein
MLQLYSCPAETNECDRCGGHYHKMAVSYNMPYLPSVLRHSEHKLVLVHRATDVSPSDGWTQWGEVSETLLSYYFYLFAAYLTRLSVTHATQCRTMDETENWILNGADGNFRVVEFQVFSRNLYEGLRKTTKCLSQDTWCFAKCITISVFSNRIYPGTS